MESVIIYTYFGFYVHKKGWKVIFFNNLEHALYCVLVNDYVYFLQQVHRLVRQENTMLTAAKTALRRNTKSVRECRQNLLGKEHFICLKKTCSQMTLTIHILNYYQVRLAIQANRLLRVVIYSTETFGTHLDSWGDEVVQCHTPETTDGHLNLWESAEGHLIMLVNGLTKKKSLWASYS